MEETYLTQAIIGRYAQNLYEEEKSSRTIEKYLRDVRHFARYIYAAYSILAWQNRPMKKWYSLALFSCLLYF